MREDRVHRASNNLSINFTEFFNSIAKSDDFCGTYKCAAIKQRNMAVCLD
jgi:energy-converting hydrogenase A subunit M